jgi:hypothetical protein
VSALAYPIYLLPEQIGKNRRALPDDDALTIAQGIPSVGAAVHISIDGVDPGVRRARNPYPRRCTMKMNGPFPAGTSAFRKIDGPHRVDSTSSIFSLRTFDQHSSWPAPLLSEQR